MIESESPSEKPKQDSQQIVEQHKQVNDEVDESAKFLSAFNQTVKRQTRAAKNGAFQNSSGKRKSLSLKDLNPTLGFGPKPNLPESGTDGQVSRTDDYLRNVELGMQTMLSTREFVYYSYYQRIKDKIRQHWEPTVREKVRLEYRQGREIASTKDHITQVIITLNRSGELVHVDIVTKSGVQALDDAAVDAFRSAAPFPNPPKGLIETDGQIRIRWDFVLEASLQKLTPKVKKIAEGIDDESTSPSRL